MTVKELIEELQEFEGDLEVRTSDHHQFGYAEVAPMLVKGVVWLT